LRAPGRGPRRIKQGVIAAFAPPEPSIPDVGTPTPPPAPPPERVREFNAAAGRKRGLLRKTRRSAQMYDLGADPFRVPARPGPGPAAFGRHPGFRLHRHHGNEFFFLSGRPGRPKARPRSGGGRAGPRKTRPNPPPGVESPNRVGMRVSARNQGAIVVPRQPRPLSARPARARHGARG